MPICKGSSGIPPKACRGCQGQQVCRRPNRTGFRARLLPVRVRVNPGPVGMQPDVPSAYPLACRPADDHVFASEAVPLANDLSLHRLEAVEVVDAQTMQRRRLANSL